MSILGLLMKQDQQIKRQQFVREVTCATQLAACTCLDVPLVVADWNARVRGLGFRTYDGWFRA